jgi:hypothetical protein
MLMLTSDGICLLDFYLMRLQALRPAAPEKNNYSRVPEFERNGATAHSDGQSYLTSVLVFPSIKPSP